MAETVILMPDQEEALCRALSRMTERSVFLAGGTDLILRLQKTHEKPDIIVSLGKMKALSQITREGDILRIGAMASHRSIASDADVRRYFPALREACDHVGSCQIRNKGTIGGNVGNASPAGDMLPVLCLFHAEAEIINGDGAVRILPAGLLLQGPGRPSLSRGEMIRAFRLPVREGRKSCFVKLGARKEVTIAEISLCVSFAQQEGLLSETEGVLGAVDTKPLYLDEIGRFFDGRKIPEADVEGLSECLSSRIEEIRLKRKRPPVMRITEAERLYKERAVKGVVYDVWEMMKQLQDT